MWFVHESSWNLGAYTVGDASDHSEDNMAISVFGEREESRDQREHFLQALSSEEETKAD